MNGRKEGRKEEGRMGGRMDGRIEGWLGRWGRGLNGCDCYGALYCTCTVPCMEGS